MTLFLTRLNAAAPSVGVTHADSTKLFKIEDIIGNHGKPDGGTTKMYAIVSGECWSGSYDKVEADHFYTFKGHFLHDGSCAVEGYTKRTNVHENNCNWGGKCFDMNKWDKPRNLVGGDHPGGWVFLM